MATVTEANKTLPVVAPKPTPVPIPNSTPTIGFWTALLRALSALAV